jgi:hypothetical protein
MSGGEASGRDGIEVALFDVREGFRTSTLP